MAAKKPMASKLRKAMAADAKQDAKRGIKQGSPRDNKIDAAVRRRVTKGK